MENEKPDQEGLDDPELEQDDAAPDETPEETPEESPDSVDDGVEEDTDESPDEDDQASQAEEEGGDEPEQEEEVAVTEEQVDLGDPDFVFTVEVFTHPKYENMVRERLAEALDELQRGLPATTLRHSEN